MDNDWVIRSDDVLNRDVNTCFYEGQDGMLNTQRATVQLYIFTRDMQVTH